MTELQYIRNVLLDEINKIKRGTSITQESNDLVKCTNAFLNTYNTELKTVDTLIKAKENSIDVKQIKVFNDSEIKEIENKD